MSSQDYVIIIGSMPVNRFEWWIDQRFTPHQVELIEAVSNDLESYLEGIMQGRAADWIRQHTAGMRIHQGGLFTQIAARITGLPTSLVLPYHDIWLWKDFDHFHLPERHVMHELGHVVENNLPKKFLSSPTIFGGGASDRLTCFLGGKPAGLRFMNGTSGIPERYQWHGLGKYGNHATADYFAEAFSWLPYDRRALPHPLVELWFKSEVFV
jgi:hypothetical protein